jgi:hypothetical protein
MPARLAPDLQNSVVCVTITGPNQTQRPHPSESCIAGSAARATRCRLKISNLADLRFWPGHFSLCLNVVLFPSASNSLLNFTTPR